MKILAQAVGRRKEAVAQVMLLESKEKGKFLINNKTAEQYLHNNTCSLMAVKAPFDILNVAQSENETPTPLSKINFDTIDTIVKVKGGGLIGQAEAIKLAIARAICEMETSSHQMELELNNTNAVVQADCQLRKQLKTKGYLTQDSRVKERRKYGLKKARKASQYHKR